MEFRIDFDTRQFEAALENFGSKAIRPMAGALYREGTRIMNRSKSEFVPVDTGNLRGSGYVSLPEIEGSSVSVEIGYGGAAAPYAAVVHENPRAGRTGGVSPQGKKYKHYAQVGQWKYLEQPVNEARDGFNQRIADDFWDALATEMG